MKTKKEVIVVGAGPAGLYAAFYCGIRGMNVTIIESQNKLGGKLNLYKEKYIWDIGGLVACKAGQVIEQLSRQAQTFEPNVILGETITCCSQLSSDLFEVSTSKGNKYYTETLILSTGTGVVTPKKLDLVEAERFEKGNLYYQITCLDLFKDKVVMISGGGDSAVQWANQMSKVAKKVYLVYRRDLFKAYEKEIEEVLESANIECLMEQKITKLMSTSNKVIEEVAIINVKGNSKKIIAIDALFVCHGYEHNNFLPKEKVMDISTIDNDYIVSDPLGCTSIPGIYVAGDVSTYLGKVNLIAGAFNDAINASNQAKQFVNPEAFERGQVSSHHEELQHRMFELEK